MEWLLKYLWDIFHSRIKHETELINVTWFSHEHVERIFLSVFENLIICMMYIIVLSCMNIITTFLTKVKCLCFVLIDCWKLALLHGFRIAYTRTNGM
jgi:hypothetical protein